MCIRDSSSIFCCCIRFSTDWWSSWCILCSWSMWYLGNCCCRTLGLWHPRNWSRSRTLYWWWCRTTLDSDRWLYCLCCMDSSYLLCYLESNRCCLWWYSCYWRAGKTRTWYYRTWYRSLSWLCDVWKIICYQYQDPFTGVFFYAIILKEKQNDLCIIFVSRT